MGAGPVGTDRSRKTGSIALSTEILILEPKSAPQHFWTPWSQFGPRSVNLFVFSGLAGGQTGQPSLSALGWWIMDDG